MRPELSSRVARLIRALASNVYSLGVRILLQFVTLPLFLHFWSARQFGEWILLSSFSTYFALSGLGIGSAGGNLIAMNAASGDLATARGVWQTTRVIVTISNVALVALVWFGANRFDVAGILGLTTISADGARNVIIASAVLIAVRLQMGVAESAFRAWGGYPEFAFIENTVQIIEVVAQVAVLLLGGYFLGAIVCCIVVRLVVLVGLAIHVQRRAPWLLIRDGAPIGPVAARLLRPALGFLMLPFAQAMELQGFALLVGGGFGPAGLSAFTAMRTLARTVLMILGLFFNILQPEVSYAVEKDNNNSKIKQLFFLSSTASILVGLGASIFLIYAGPSIFRVWTGSKVVFDSGVFHMILLCGVLRAVSMPPAAVLLGLNRHGLLVGVTILGSAAALVVGWVFVETTHNMVAVAGASIVIELALIAYCVSAMLRLLHLTAGQYVLGLLDTREAWSYAVKILRRTRRSRTDT
ncbi:MAG: hypothetical protein WB816_12345 [Methylocystis sp.]